MSTMMSAHNIQGLTEQEARERLAQHGYNELPSTQKRMLLIACGLCCTCSWATRKKR